MLAGLCYFLALPWFPFGLVTLPFGVEVKHSRMKGKQQFVFKWSMEMSERERKSKGLSFTTTACMQRNDERSSYVWPWCVGRGVWRWYQRHTTPTQGTGTPLAVGGFESDRFVSLPYGSSNHWCFVTKTAVDEPLVLRVILVTVTVTVRSWNCQWCAAGKCWGNMTLLAPAFTGSSHRSFFIRIAVIITT